MSDLRIVLHGKTGDGKSSSGNTILGENMFSTGHSPSSITHKCESRKRCASGREITVVDVPGLFDTSVPEEVLKAEVLKCITYCAPGAHAIVVVLTAGRYTKHEEETLKEITAFFGEEALKHTVVLFTHGDQLSEDQTIEDFVGQNTKLQEFVNKCGGRVHVIDNKYWNQQQEGYRSNRVQVENLLNTIEKMVRENGGQCYTNEMLQAVHREIEEEYERIRNESISKKENKQSQEMREQARQRVHTRWYVRLVGVGTGVLVGALLGCASAVAIIVAAIYKAAGSAASIAASAAASKAGIAVAGTVLGAATLAGAVGGGMMGYKAVEGAETMTDAMKLAAKAPFEKAKETINQAMNLKLKYHQL